MSLKPPRTFMYWGTSPESQTFPVPWPSVGNAFETQRAVDSARNAYNEVVATQVGRAADKQNMGWTALDPQIWYDLNNWLLENGMFFWCRYFDFNSGRERVRAFYVGDISAEPYQVDEGSFTPRMMVSCKMNVIDQGRINE